VLGWTSAVAAYGAFIIPMVFRSAIQRTGAPDQALYLFVAFYLVSLVILWYFYLRKSAQEYGA
jgi:NNP family nitrate/nitrite transporter-like MFS transporter